MYTTELTPLEKKIITLCEVYKTVTAEQIAEALKIEWAEADQILYHLELTHQLIKSEHWRSGLTTFHFVEI